MTTTIVVVVVLATAALAEVASYCQVEIDVFVCGWWNYDFSIKIEKKKTLSAVFMVYNLHLHIN